MYCMNSRGDSPGKVPIWELVKSLGYSLVLFAASYVCRVMQTHAILANFPCPHDVNLKLACSSANYVLDNHNHDSMKYL